MLLKAENISKIINGQKIFSDKSLVVKENDVIGIIGKNGSGKSMFLKTLLGIKAPTSGSIEKKSDLRYDFYLNNNFLYFEYSLYDNIRMYSLLKNGNVDNQKIDNLLHFFYLKHDSKKKVRKLSTGQKQRLALLVSLINYESLELLILDEPFSNLDIEFKDSIIDFIFRLNCAKIICNHELESIERHLTKKMYFEGGTE